jgi:carbonic anhydrase
MDVIYRYDPFAPLEHRPVTDGDAAIKTLVRGHNRYATIVKQIHREILGGPAVQEIVIPSNPLALGLPCVAGTAPTQTPFALVLGCSDARVPIEQVFDQSPNDLFVIRVAGNVLGVECLGSIDYAVAHLGETLKLVVVLGHSSCGAVTAAVESYLAPKNYAGIAFTHALRSLVDRIHAAVRGAARALEQVGGDRVARRGDFRRLLLDVAVYLNAAITAFDVERELKTSAAVSTRVVFGVFDLVAQRVRSTPLHDTPVFSDVPRSPTEFERLGIQIAGSILEQQSPGRDPRKRRAK